MSRRRRRSGNRGHRLQQTRVGPNGRTHRPEPYRQTDSDPENVVCPRCDAGPGDRCETRTGDERDPHAARIRTAAGNPPPDSFPRREHAIATESCPICGATETAPCLRRDGRPRRAVHLARLERAEHFDAHTTAAGAAAPAWGGGQASGRSTPG